MQEVQYLTSSTSEVLGIFSITRVEVGKMVPFNFHRVKQKKFIHSTALEIKQASSYLCVCVHTLILVCILWFFCKAHECNDLISSFLFCILFNEIMMVVMMIVTSVC